MMRMKRTAFNRWNDICAHISIWQAMIGSHHIKLCSVGYCTFVSTFMRSEYSRCSSFFCISFARLSRPAVNIVEQIHFYLNRWGMCRETNLNHNVCTMEIKGTKLAMSEDRLNWAIWFDSSFFLLQIFLHLLSMMFNFGCSDQEP